MHTLRRLPWIVAIGLVVRLMPIDLAVGAPADTHPVGRRSASATPPRSARTRSSMALRSSCASGLWCLERSS